MGYRGANYAEDKKAQGGMADAAIITTKWEGGKREPRIPLAPASALLGLGRARYADRNAAQSKAHLSKPSRDHNSDSMHPRAQSDSNRRKHTCVRTARGSRGSRTPSPTQHRYPGVCLSKRTRLPQLVSPLSRCQRQRAGGQLARRPVSSEHMERAA